MNKFVRELIIPIAAGAAIHIALNHAYSLISANPIVDTSIGPSRLMLFIHPWLDLSISVLPGFVAGGLSTHRSMLNGFLAAFIGMFLVFYLIETVMFQFTDPSPNWTMLENCLRAGIYGLVSGAAGFMTARALTTQSR
jgi:hypothetical protein